VNNAWRKSKDVKIALEKSFSTCVQRNGVAALRALVEQGADDQQAGREMSESALPASVGRAIAAPHRTAFTICAE